MTPFLKYPGGKRLLAERILDLLAPSGEVPTTLYEPFLGAGAVSLAALGRWPHVQVWGSDAAKPLTDTWNAVLQVPNMVAAVLDDLTEEPCTEARYYELRARYNNFPMCWDAPGLAERAALAIYLNRAGFNGLWRFNRKGELNVGWGKRPDVRVDFDAKAWTDAGRRMLVRAEGCDWALSRLVSGPGTVVYLDPPYAAPRGSDARPFVAYGTGLGWTMDDTFAVVDLATRVAQNGARVVLSHSADESPGGLNEKLRDSGWTITSLDVKRTISRNGATRAPVREILATLGGHP